MKKFLNVLILLIFNHVFPMDRFGGSSAQAMVRPQQNDYLNSVDDFLTFVVERFTLENEDYSPFLQELSDKFNDASRRGRVLKSNVNDWIDNIMSRRQQQEGVVELTPEQLRPVDLVCDDPRSPYFVNRYALSKLPFRDGNFVHPLNKLPAKVLDMPASWDYWVGSGKMSRDQWLEILRQGDSLTCEEFNLDGLDYLISNQSNQPSLQQANAAVTGIPALSTSAELQEDNPELLQASLKSIIDNEISERGGVNGLTGAGNETRTLLMDYATTGNLPAVQYLIDKGADLKVEDSYYGQGNPGRTAIIFPAFYGHADVVEYFASDRFPKIDTTEARKWADGYNQSREGFSQSKKDRILAALNKIDAKALQRAFAGGGQAAI